MAVRISKGSSIVIPGRRYCAGPGIQSHALCLHLWIPGSRHSGVEDARKRAYGAPRNDEEASVIAPILCGAGCAVVLPRHRGDQSFPSRNARGWSTERRTSLSVLPRSCRQERGRLSALHGGDFCPRGRSFRTPTGPSWAPDPAGFRPPSSAPRPAHRRALPRSRDGRLPGTPGGARSVPSRPRAPHLLPPARRLMRAPSRGGDGWNIILARNKCQGPSPPHPEEPAKRASRRMGRPMVRDARLRRAPHHEAEQDPLSPLEPVLGPAAGWTRVRGRAAESDRRRTGQLARPRLPRGDRRSMIGRLGRAGRTPADSA